MLSAQCRKDRSVVAEIGPARAELVVARFVDRVRQCAAGVPRMASLALLLAFALAPRAARAQSLGNATFTPQTSCPTTALVLPELKTTCYEITIQNCPGGSTFIAWLKVTKRATGIVKGTVLMTSGDGGSSWYDQSFVYGSLIVNALAQAGYAAAQIDFTDFSDSIEEPSGWLTVLDGSNQGPGNLACRYATLATDYLTDHSYPGGKLAATGNSAGGSLVAYALARYGLGAAPVLTVAEITSGPPLARVDYGCLCNQTPTLTSAGQGFASQCYFGSGSVVVDPTYAATPAACSGAETSHTEPAGINFLADSIANGSEITGYPQTTLNVLFGGQDNGAAVANALNWANPAVISAKSFTITDIPDAPHLLEDSLPGALQVINDLTNF